MYAIGTLCIKDQNGVCTCMSSNYNYPHMRPATSKNILVFQQFFQRHVHEIATWKSL